MRAFRKNFMAFCATLAFAAASFGLISQTVNARGLEKNIQTTASLGGSSVIRKDLRLATREASNVTSTSRAGQQVAGLWGKIKSKAKKAYGKAKSKAKKAYGKAKSAYGKAKSKAKKAYGKAKSAYGKAKSKAKKAYHKLKKKACVVAKWVRPPKHCRS